MTTTEAGTTVQYDGGSVLKGVVFLANDTGFGNSAASFPAALGGWAGGHVANGIYGYTEVNGGNAIVGVAAGGANSVGVTGTNGAGTAIMGISGAGTGVRGSGSTGVAAVGSTIAVNANGPTAVLANGTGAAGQGVKATNNSATNAAVKAANSGTGNGIHATSSGGRGGVFGGASAQIQLAPGSRSTHPTSGLRGDLYADKTGRLWFCKKGGTHATWHQIA